MPMPMSLRAVDAIGRLGTFFVRNTKRAIVVMITVWRPRKFSAQAQ
jgi:hypothetical protein